MPTVLILIFTLLIMVTVIPYSFSNVIKQLQAVRLLEQQRGDKITIVNKRGGSKVRVPGRKYQFSVSSVIAF